MKYLKEKFETSITINKSEFISVLYPIKDDSDINKYILETKTKYPKATHYVTAWVRGERGQYASSNDDGEPSKTAGYPALNVLMQNNITDVLVVIVRYFGGVKLGAGGLIRAYSSSCSEAVNNAKYYRLLEAPKYLLKFPYNLIDQVEHLLKDYVKYLKKDYLAHVEYEVIFMEQSIDLLKDIIHQMEIIDLGISLEHVDI